MNIKIIIFSFLCFGCAVVPAVYQLNQPVEDSWKNPKYAEFKPKKILVLAIFKDLNDRNILENNFNHEFTQRGIMATASHKKYAQQFTISLKTEEELKSFADKLLADGFDAIFINAIKGVEKQLDYKKDYYKIYHDWYRFNNYFNYNQDVFIFPNYNYDFKYYNLESALYAVNGKADKTLIWAGVIKIIDPLKINEIAHQHLKSILKELEQQQIIPKKST